MSSSNAVPSAVSGAELAEPLSRRFKGASAVALSKPDSVPRKALVVSKLLALGWRAQSISIKQFAKATTRCVGPIGPGAALNACPVSNVLSEVSIGPWRIRDDQLPPFDRREVRPI